jgi:hypothetical protein
MDQKTHDKGLEIRKAVLGEAYVNNALKNADGFNKPLTSRSRNSSPNIAGARCGAATNCRARPAACSTSPRSEAIHLAA